jgi:hypothetical protein
VKRAIENDKEKNMERNIISPFLTGKYVTQYPPMIANKIEDKYNPCGWMNFQVGGKIKANKMDGPNRFA